MANAHPQHAVFVTTALIGTMIAFATFSECNFFVSAIDRDTVQLQRDIAHYSKVAYDGKTFAKLLHLHNGDPISRVNQILSPLTIVEFDIFNGDFRSIISMDAAGRPDRYPDGVVRGDVLLEVCCVQPGYIYLQLRNGVLVNFSPNNYRDLLDYK